MRRHGALVRMLGLPGLRVTALDEERVGARFGAGLAQMLNLSLRVRVCSWACVRTLACAYVRAHVCACARDCQCAPNIYKLGAQSTG
jgi:hypothetical protein